MTDSRAKRRRGRRGRDAGESSVWVERLWRFGARPAFVGALMFVAGLVLVLAIFSSLPDTPTQGWWVAALRFPDAVQAAATMLVVAFVFALGTAVARFRQPVAAERRQVLRLGTAAVLLMGAGAFASVFVWFAAQADLPPSRVSVPNGQTIQSFPAIESGSSFKVMLPERLKVVSVDPEAPKGTVELREPGEEEGVKNDIFVGDPLDVGGFRFALVGLEYSPTVPAVILGKQDGIDVRGTRGSKVRFEPDGPEYEIKQIARNYLGFMGPAAQLADPDGDTFWVFQRETELDRPFSGFHLRQVETAPVAVFAVAATPMHRYASIGAILLMLGLALFVFVSDPQLARLGPSREGDS